MARWLAIYLLLCCSVSADAQQRVDTKINVVGAESGPADLRLSGPTIGVVGQPLAVIVSGLPAVDLTQNIGEQTRWIDSLRFDVSVPGSATATLEKELSMSVSPWEWRLRLTMTPPVNGCYVIVCDWNEAPYGLALHRVDVGGSPTVPPPVVVTPDPQLTGEAYIVVIRRMDDLTADQAAVLVKLRTWVDGQLGKVQQLEFSPEADDEAVKSYVLKLPAGAELPYVFLARTRKDGQGASVIWNGELPARAEDLQAKVTELAL